MATITSTRGVARLMRELSDLIEVDLRVIYRKTALDLFTRIVMLTPVDTGRARASWRVGIGAPDTSVAPEGQGGDAVGPAAARLNTVRVRDVTYITNSLPYIEALENGHSRQAPNGMIRMALAETQRDLQNLVSSLR